MNDGFGQYNNIKSQPVSCKNAPWRPFIAVNQYAEFGCNIAGVSLMANKLTSLEADFHYMAAAIKSVA
jgi:hypothetical protein